MVHEVRPTQASLRAVCITDYRQPTTDYFRTPTSSPSVGSASSDN